MSKPIVIYHGNCADGFAAAWCFWRIYGDHYDYHHGVYNAKVPDIVDRDVYMVDFSYKRDVVANEILPFANSVTLIDHHKSALEDLWDLESAGLNMKPSSLDHSGAVLAWKYVQEQVGHKDPIPRLINHIEDRDLWKFKLPDTKAISEVIFCNEYDFKVWDKLLNSNKRDVMKMIPLGKAINKKHMKDVHELISQIKRYMIFGNLVVPTANVPYMMASDVGSIMSLDEPFAATYYDTESHRVFSLRSNASNPNAADVSEIALRYGGGGHKHAAGFKVPRNHPLGMA